jgi:hypothetical protein|nr:MAG TPA: hypothetical protein [Caudoviricetes sp.]
MKTNEHKHNNRGKLLRIAVEAVVAIIGLAGLALLAGDEAPDTVVPLTLAEWLAIKAAGVALLVAAVVAGRAAYRSGIIY